MSGVANLSRLLRAAFEAALGPTLTAWPSQGKAAIRAGLFPEMPLGVRSPYRAATEADVARVRTLIETQFPEFAIEPESAAARR